MSNLTTVLVVEDNPIDVLLLTTAFRKRSDWKTELTVVNDGEHAIHLIDSGFLPHLVILDLNLPKVSGFDVLQKFRSHPATRDLPVIIFSSSPGDVPELYASTKTARFSKPTDVKTYWSITHQFRRFYEPNSARSPEGIAFGIHPLITMPPVATPPVPMNVKGKQRILVVEDAADNRFLLTAYCKNSDYHLTFAVNGEEGVDHFRADAFSIVVMDLHMPVMDGFAATRLIRDIEKERRAQRTPVMILTASVTPHDRAKAWEVGCDVYLPKPISRSAFLVALADVATAYLKPSGQTAIGQVMESAGHTLTIW